MTHGIKTDKMDALVANVHVLAICATVATIVHIDKLDLGHSL